MAGAPLRSLLQYLRRTAQPALADGTDRELLARFAANRDEAAFTALVRRHAAMVLAVCRRVLGNDHDAEEAFQAAFVVLAAKAGATGWHESVAGWLQAVAFRAASNHRASTSRRQRREREVPQMQPVDSLATEVAARDLRRVLDEELSRLPEKCRIPVVLCYLEGKTNVEAAEHLGWTLGAVAGRLAQGRDLLRGRLARRGLGLSAAALPAALTNASAGAAVPATLIDCTIQATMLGQAALVGPVASIAEGVLKTMWLTKVKASIVVLLTVVAVGTGATVGAYRALGDSNRRVALVPVLEPDAKPKPAQNGGPVVKGLQLTLTANKTETVMKADRSNAEPVELTWTLTNVSDQPIKVDLYRVTDYGGVNWHYDVKAVGPDKDSVQIMALDGRPPRKIPAREGDYVTLAPGKSVTERIPYPVSPRPYELLAFLKAGEYRITVTYKNDSVASNEFAANSWTGSVTSNELVLTVR